MVGMTESSNRDSCPFDAREREYIRRELDIFFGTLPSVAEGFQLRTWRTGPHAGNPKVPPALRSMVDRGLMEIRTGTGLFACRAFFTETGVAALRRLIMDRRYMNFQKFAHVRAELGFERATESVDLESQGET